MAIEKKFISEGVLQMELKDFIKKFVGNIGLSSIYIQKTPLVTRIQLVVDKPGLVIGRRGANLQKMAEELKKKFGIDSPEIDIQPVENQLLDAQIVSHMIARSLEKGINPRSVVQRAVSNVMRAGAKGVEVTISGKLAGKGSKKKKMKKKEGHIKKSGETQQTIDHGYSTAIPKSGLIGVTVNLARPNAVFPDEMPTNFDNLVFPAAGAVAPSAAKEAVVETKGVVKAEKKEAPKGEKKEAPKAKRKAPAKKPEAKKEVPAGEKAEGKAEQPKEETKVEAPAKVETAPASAEVPLPADDVAEELGK